MLVINLEADLPQIDVKLYPDYGDGYTENGAFKLVSRRGLIGKRLCYFPKLSIKLRLDPSEVPCNLDLKHLSLIKVTKRFAVSRMTKKINENGRGGLPQNGDIGSLWQEYQEFFNHQWAARTYQEWLKDNEGADYFTSIGNETDYQPLISIIVPVWNTPAELLRKCIESVCCQTYSSWQLCLSDDASSEPHVRTILTEYANKDSRIDWGSRKDNGHICNASNSALELVEGEFVALLDHDDELSAHALAEVVRALQSSPRAMIIYSDEDKIDEAGNRFDPHFKSEWNRDLLYSQNYISHLGVYRTELVRQVGGFRPGFEGSQDYDLLLRCLARIADEEIVHIPKVLYHWRAVEGSTALASNCKLYTEQAGIRALGDHFKVLGQDVQVSHGKCPNTYRVQWPMPVETPLVSLLIPTRDGYQLLKQCIDSILTKTVYDHYEILILDNQSTCEKTLNYLDQLKAHQKIRVLQYDSVFNFSAINNFGVAKASGEIVGLINNDIEVISGEWLSEMVCQVMRPDIGCVGAKLYYTNNTIQHAGVILGVGGVAGHSHKYFNRNHHGYFSRLKIVQNLSAVTGACLLVRKSLFHQVGGLDEDNLAIAFNDIDFCLKVRQAGYRNLWTPYAELYHHESASRGAEDTPEKVQRFDKENKFMLEKWAEEIGSDPFYSPNLTRTVENFSLL